MLIVKGNDGNNPLKSVGVTIQWTGTLWTLGNGQDYMFDMTIKNVDGTQISNSGGTVSKSRVNLEQIFITFEDYEDTNNILKFKVHNNYNFVLAYKYGLFFRYFNDL